MRKVFISFFNQDIKYRDKLLDLNNNLNNNSFINKSVGNSDISDDLSDEQIRKK